MPVPVLTVEGILASLRKESIISYANVVQRNGLVSQKDQLTKLCLHVHPEGLPLVMEFKLGVTLIKTPFAIEIVFTVLASHRCILVADAAPWQLLRLIQLTSQLPHQTFESAKKIPPLENLSLQTCLGKVYSLL